MLESSEISKKKNRAKAIVALAFCLAPPFSAEAQTSNQLSKSDLKQVNDAQLAATIVINESGATGEKGVEQLLKETVEFPDNSFSNTNSNSTNPLVPEGTRSYSKDEIYRLIATESEKIGVDPQFVYIIADIESGFDQYAISEVGAVGVMQLMPATAAELGVINSYDAAQNIRGGISYLNQLLHEFGNPLMAAAAYHSGPQTVRDANGIPKGTRTAKYMVRILNDYYRIAESNFNPSSTSSVKSVSSIKARPVKRKKTVTPKPRVSAETVQEGNPNSWDAGFVLHLE